MIGAGKDSVAIIDFREIGVENADLIKEFLRGAAAAALPWPPNSWPWYEAPEWTNILRLLVAQLTNGSDNPSASPPSKSKGDQDI